MKNVLVLGGAGFIGAALTHRLRELDYDVTAVDRYWTKPPTGVNCITGDVFDVSCLREAMVNQDIVFHLASTTLPASSNKSPVFDCETNVIGALKILDAMVENNVPKIVFSSSGGTIYGIPDSIPIREDFPVFPISAYGIGKLTIERYLNLYAYLHGLKTTSLRISNPYGSGQIPEKGQGVIATFVKRALLDETIDVWGDGSVIRDFIYIDDVVEALVAAAQLETPFSVLNIGSGEGKSLLDLLHIIEKALQRKLVVNFQSSRPCDVPAVVLDIQKAQTLIGWQPKRSFEQGLKMLIVQMQTQLNA